MRRLNLLIWALAIALLLSPGLVAAQATDFVADLSGSQEVRPIETVATGQASFQLNADNTALTFELTVANIEDVTATHIHCASTGVIGPPGVTLSGGAPGPINGILAQGTVTAPDSGNGCDWNDFAAVVAGIGSGNTYVQVHTLGNPAGEIRGQIQ